MSVGAYALCTLANAKSYLGVSPEVDGIWLFCVGPSSATAEVSDAALILKTSITTVHRACSASNVATIGTSAAHGLLVGSSVVITGMTDVTYNGTFTVVAVVDSTHFTFALTHAVETETADTGGTCAGTTTLTLSAAANDTITELVAVINAGGGWKAGAICNGSASSTDLIVTGAQSCLGATAELTLKIEDNYGLELLINRSSDLIERYCNRKFVSRSYDRIPYTGNGRSNLILHQYPVTHVFRVSEGTLNTFYVSNTTAKNFATVEVNATKIRLCADGAVTDKTLSDYATINLLIAAINATSGWSATLISGGTRACTYTTSAGGSNVASELVVMPAQRCLSPSVAYVLIPNIEVDDYTLVGGGGDEDRDPGILYRAGGWARGVTYFVDAVCGFSSIPAALEEACILMVKYAIDKKSKDGVLQGEVLGDYSYQMGVMGNTFSKDLFDQLNLFRAFEF